MRTIRMLSLLTLAGFVLFATVPAEAQSGRVAKKAAKEATKVAAGDAAKGATMDAAAGAAKKAAAPDAVDLNTASAEQMKKLGLDEATQKKVVAGRPYSSLDDAKLKEAIPAGVLSKLEGKVTVKPKAK
jgi:DNA uptake protein ComE-like DNA-binding protein